MSAANAAAPQRAPEAVFQFRVPPSHFFGSGAVERIGDEARRLGAQRALVITDPGVERTGIAARVRELLGAAGIATGLYAEVQPEPSVASVERATAAALGADGGTAYDLLVGVGGGSAMDTAKGVSLRTANPGPIQRYF